MAFACGELGLRLHDFYDMPWCEYLIMCFAHDRMQVDELKKIKYLAYHSLLGSPNIDAKKLPSLHKFVNGQDAKLKKASDRTKNQLLKEAEEYYKLIKVKK